MLPAAHVSEGDFVESHLGHSGHVQKPDLQVCPRPSLEGYRPGYLRNVQCAQRHRDHRGFLVKNGNS